MTTELFVLPAGEFFLTACVVFLAAFLQSLTGFGFVLLSVPLLALCSGVKAAIPLIACTAFLNAVILFAHLRENAKTADICLLLPGSVMAVPLGAWFLAGCDETVVRVSLAAMLIGYVCLSISGRFRVDLKSRAWPVAFGVASGFFGGAFNTASPPIIIYAQLMGWGKDALRASMALYLIATTTVVIVSHYVAGLSGVQTFITAAALVPVLFAASRIGMRISSRIPGALFTNVVYGVLVLLAVLLLIKK